MRWPTLVELSCGLAVLMGVANGLLTDRVWLAVMAVAVGVGILWWRPRYLPQRASARSTTPAAALLNGTLAWLAVALVPTLLVTIRGCVGID